MILEEVLINECIHNGYFSKIQIYYRKTCPKKPVERISDYFCNSWGFLIKFVPPFS
jgi:hypothetical protein